MRMAVTRRHAAAIRGGAWLLALAAFASATGAEAGCVAPPPPELAALESVDSASDWFRVHAVAPGVFAISEPRQYEGVTSFLVIGAKRVAVRLGPRRGRHPRRR